MSYLLDTNVMWRRFYEADPLQPSVKAAVDSLILSGDMVCITAQNLVEFQSLATRPAEVNGLGLSTEGALERAEDMKSAFSFLDDTPEVYVHWRALVQAHDIKGKQVHDARLVAVMLTYGVKHLVTMNANHFRRFPEITVVDLGKSI